MRYEWAWLTSWTSNVYKFRYYHVFDDGVNMPFGILLSVYKVERFWKAYTYCRRCCIRCLC